MRSRSAPAFRPARSWTSRPSRDIKLIDMTDIYEDMRKINPAYKLVTIPKGTYPKQDKDVQVIGYYTHVVAACSLPEDTVYKMTAAILPKKDEHGCDLQGARQADAADHGPGHRRAVPSWRRQVVQGAGHHGEVVGAVADQARRPGAAATPPQLQGRHKGRGAHQMTVSATMREWPRKLTAAVALAMALYHVYVIIPPLDFISPSLREVFRGPPTDYIFRAIHLMFAMVLTFLWYRLKSPTDEQLEMLTPEQRAEHERRTGEPSLLDWLLIAASIVSIGYIFVYYDYIIDRIIYVDDMTWSDIILSVTLILLVLEGTRRVLGLAMSLVCVAFMAYGYFFTNIEVTRFIDQLYLSTEGIFGQSLAVSASYVMIFVLFGAFMERTGTGQLFMDFAMGITGHTAGGPGKVSVVSSSLFGTISGSAVANVMVDGPISIPLMKRTGFKPHFAAAVEATASTGGQIMPPIMGAAAFVMAEFQGVSYAQVVIWAAIPAILYYVACFAAVHFEAKRQGLLGVPRSELPALMQVLRARGHLFIPVSWHPVRHVLRLQRTAGGAHRHAALLPGGLVRSGDYLRPADTDRASLGPALDADVGTVGLRAATARRGGRCSRR